MLMDAGKAHLSTETCLLLYFEACVLTQRSHSGKGNKDCVSLSFNNTTRIRSELTSVALSSFQWLEWNSSADSAGKCLSSVSSTKTYVRSYTYGAIELSDC